MPPKMLRVAEGVAAQVTQGEGEATNKERNVEMVKVWKMKESIEMAEREERENERELESLKLQNGEREKERVREHEIQIQRLQLKELEMYNKGLCSLGIS